MNHQPAPIFYGQTATEGEDSIESPLSLLPDVGRRPTKQTQLPDDWQEGSNDLVGDFGH